MLFRFFIEFVSHSIVFSEQQIDQFRGVNYYPNRDYALHIPVTALFLFLATPLLYAALNSFTVPKLNSIDSVEDVYTKSSSKSQILSRKIPFPE